MNKSKAELSILISVSTIYEAPHTSAELLKKYEDSNYGGRVPPNALQVARRFHSQFIDLMEIFIEVAFQAQIRLQQNFSQVQR